MFYFIVKLIYILEIKIKRHSSLSFYGRYLQDQWWQKCPSKETQLKFNYLRNSFKLLSTLLQTQKINVEWMPEIETIQESVWS